MKERILGALNTIEQEHNIRVLYACEAGSRCYGTVSPDSDYDVRFIYLPHPDFYLSIDPPGSRGKKDTLQEMIEPDLDLAGWELAKALRLARKSNPSFFEWIHSPMIYMNQYELADRLAELEDELFSAKTCFFHYYNMAERNWKRAQTDMNPKMLLSVLRPLFCCSWIEEAQSFPLVQFSELTARCKSPQVLKEAAVIAADKKRSGISDLIENSNISRFILGEFNRLKMGKDKLHSRSVDVTLKLDRLFRQFVKDVW